VGKARLQCVETAYLWDESGPEEAEAIEDQKPTAARSGHVMEPIQDPGPYNALLHARRTSFVYPWRALAPGPCNGSVFCPLLVVSVRKEPLAFCTSYGRFLSFVSAVPPLRVFSAASLSFCITLLAVPLPRPASPARWHAVHLRQFSDVLVSCTLPPAVTGTRSLFWQNGQPLLVLCSSALLVKKCLLQYDAIQL